jgi:hypothetical protein
MDTNNRIPWEVIIGRLMCNNKAAFFQVLFNALSKHPSYIIVSDMEYNKKIGIINDMISFYEKKEAYEKCSVLISIKKEIDEC